MARIELLFLDRPTVESLVPPMPAVIDIVAEGLAAHGRGEVVLPPKGHLYLDRQYNGHFNILPGYSGPHDLAGVKVIGDYVDNWRHGLPSEVALLTLYDPRTGLPLAIMDATVMTWLRTGAVTGIGARHLARADAAVVTHVGARGTAFGNLLAIAAVRPIREIRIASKRPETRKALAARVQAATGIPTHPVDLAREVVIDADIVVEATRLEQPEDLVPGSWIKPGALLVTYGFVRAVSADLPRVASRFVVDDWAQCQLAGTFALEIKEGRLKRKHLSAEIGQIVAGLAPGRQGDDERIVFWHRGFAISDIVLGAAVLKAAQAAGRGVPLTLGEGADE